MRRYPVPTSRWTAKLPTPSPFSTERSRGRTKERAHSEGALRTVNIGCFSSFYCSFWKCPRLTSTPRVFHQPRVRGRALAAAFYLLLPCLIASTVAVKRVWYCSVHAMRPHESRAVHRLVLLALVVQFASWVVRLLPESA